MTSITVSENPITSTEAQRNFGKVLTQIQRSPVSIVRRGGTGAVVMTDLDFNILTVTAELHKRFGEVQQLLDLAVDREYAENLLAAIQSGEVVLIEDQRLGKKLSKAMRRYEGAFGMLEGLEDIKHGRTISFKNTDELRKYIDNNEKG